MPIWIMVITQTCLLTGLISVLIFRSNTAHSTQAAVETKLAIFEKQLERVEKILGDELTKAREESQVSFKSSRQELATSLTTFNQSLANWMKDISTVQKNQLDIVSQKLDTLTQTNEKKLEMMRETIEKRILGLQDDNNKKLEQMRVTVDEKLHATLEKRLGDSFKLVSERLELVHKGLGEMQVLATGVGDLKKVLTNVKTRGIWGEIQLGAILEQLLTMDQYGMNVATKPGSADRVEYAIKLPGTKGNAEEPIWLPIDAKFPQDPYIRLLDAQELADPILAEEAAKFLEQRIKGEAKNMRDKYIDPPHTTDFGILFLPIEGLYAEVLRRPGLHDTLQKEYRVIIAGPTTLTAILNSLQMGFRTLAIEKRSSEVWGLLSTVKSEFSKFGTLLDKTQKKLQEASNTIETATQKSRTIERKLRTVQDLPTPESPPILDSGELPLLDSLTTLDA